MDAGYALIVVVAGGFVMVVNYLWHVNRSLGTVIQYLATIAENTRR